MAGIANGVASDMTESASQVPLGCMGLDSIMGYVNSPADDRAQYGASRRAADERPVTYNNGFDGHVLGHVRASGAVIGMSDARTRRAPRSWGRRTRSRSWRTSCSSIDLA